MDESDRSARLPVQVVRAAAAMIGVVGLIWLGRWARPFVAYVPSDGTIFRQQVGWPLRNGGAAAAVLSVAAAVLARHVRRRPAVALVAVAALVGGGAAAAWGQVEYHSQQDVWPALHEELASLPVPAGWRLKTRIDKVSGSLAPRTQVIWTAPGESSDQACREATSALEHWPGTGSVSRSPGDVTIGIACRLGAARVGRHASASVAATTSGLRHDFYFVNGSDGPAIGLSLGLQVRND